MQTADRLEDLPEASRAALKRKFLDHQKSLSLHFIFDELISIVRLFGMVHSKHGVMPDPSWRSYALLMITYFWAWTIRVCLLYVKENDEMFKEYTLDITVFWTGKRGFYLSIDFSYGLAAALITTHFYLSMKTNTWVEKFSHLWDETSNRTEGLNNRIELSAKTKRYHDIKGNSFRMFIVFLATIIAIIAFNFNKIRSERHLWELILASVVFQQLSYCTILFSSIFFVQTCLCLRQRFEEVYYDLYQLYDEFSNNLIPENEYYNNIGLLKSKHFKVCEMVSIANQFWRTWLGAVASVLTPFAFFATYEVIFVTNEQQLTLTIAWFGVNAWIILFFIAFNAANISGMAHAPNEVLFRITLNHNLPFDTKLQLKDFIQRLNGPTIGLACLDLFVITHPRIYSICIGMISYFVIVIDMGKRHEFDHYCTLPNGTIVSDLQLKADINNTLYTTLLV